MRLGVHREKYGWPVLVAGLVLVLLAAFGLRLIGLDRQSIWDDEGSAIFRASLPLTDVASMVLRAGNAERIDTNPPFYFLVLAVWLRLTGTSAFALRYLSVVCGCVAVAAAFPLARRIGGLGVGIVALALAAFSPFYAYYSQETRMYALLAALVTLYLHALLRARESHRARWWALVAIVGALGLYTHYYTVFLFVAVAAWLVAELALSGKGPPLTSTAAWRNLVSFGLAHLAVGLAFVPWVLANLDLARQFTVGAGSGTTVASVLERSLLAFSTGNGVEPGDPNQLGALYPALHLQAVLLAVPFLLAFVVGAGRWGHGVARSADARLGVASLAIVPAVVLVATAGPHVDFTPRYLTLAFPAFLVPTAAGVVVATRRYRPLGAGLGLTLLGISVYATWHGAVYPGYWRPDVRDAVRYLETNAVEPSAVVVNASYTFPAYLYYRRSDDPWIGLPAQHPPDAAATEAALEQLRAHNREVWVLLWGDYYSDPDGIVLRWLDANAYPKASASFPGGVRAVGYTTRPPVVADPHPARPVDETLGNLFELIGYDPPVAAQPGTSVTVRLYWKALAPVGKDLTMFAQLHDAGGKLWAHSDSRPHQGLFPTQRWVPGAAVAEDRAFALPASMPAGAYTLDVGWYDLRTMARVGADPSYLSIPLDVGPPRPV